MQTVDDDIASPAGEPLSFAVAGIGVSEGGLDALKKVLGALGGAPALAICVIHHGDPASENELCAALSTATGLPVRVARDGERVARNRIYVIPMDAAATLVRGAFRLARSPQAQGRIDRFLVSLARDLGPRAVAVILSGGGRDGSLGVRAVRQASGIVIAQDASAQRQRKPHAAVATGCVDLVLRPEAIGAELARLGRALANGADSASCAEATLRSVAAVAERATGLSFRESGLASLARRGWRRALVHRFANVSEYAAAIGNNPREARALAEEALVHEATLFRDPRTFDVLKERVFPALIREREHDAPIRIWVPACSTGEDVVSLAICLFEYLEQVGRTDLEPKIFGTDANAPTIGQARLNLLTNRPAAALSPERLARFFAMGERGYELRATFRDAITLAVHDLARDTPLGRMDLVFCRNLVLRFAAPGTELSELARYAVRDGGFLVLGSSTGVTRPSGFKVVDAEHNVFARHPRARDDDSPHDAWRAYGTWPAPRDPIVRAAGKALLGAISSAIIVAEDLDIVAIRGDAAAWFAPDATHETKNVLALVHPSLRSSLRYALDAAAMTGRSARRLARWNAGSQLEEPYEIHVLPFVTGARLERHFLLLLRRLVPDVAAPPAPRRKGRGRARSDRGGPRAPERDGGAREHDDESLVKVKERLQETHEELHATREELQAVNAELRIVNNALTARNEVMAQLNDDLANVLASVDLPIVLVNADGRLRRFTPAATRVFPFVAKDIGRPVSDLRGRIPLSELAEALAEVERRGGPWAKVVQADDGSWHQITVQPYRTLDGRVDGAVLTVVDVDALKKSELAVAEARRFATSIIDSTREALVVLDAAHRVRAANLSYYVMFGRDQQTIDGARLLDVDGGAWDVPEIRALLFAPEADRQRGVYVERDTPRLGRRILLVSARRIADSTLTLLAIDDITERALLERRVAEYQARLQRAGYDAAVAEELERRRIAMDLHDGVGASLAAAMVYLKQAYEVADPSATPALDRAMPLVAQSIRETRTLLFDLSPPILYELGLKAALRWLCEQSEARFGLPCTFEDDGSEVRFDDDTSALLFRCVRELLLNIFKHANASSARVSLRRGDGDDVSIETSDDGVGFDADAVARSGGASFGLFNIRERMVRLGGALDVRSAPGKGSHLALRVPFSAKSITAPTGEEGGT